MSVCPNVNTPEWKALEAKVGKFEAFRDFMENNFEIRDPETVAAKIAIRTELSLKEIPGDITSITDFEGTLIEYIDHIGTHTDGRAIGARNINKGEKIQVVLSEMRKKFEEKSWVNPVNSEPLSQDEFSSFEELMLFMYLHEKAHEYILRESEESLKAYETRVNNEALRRLRTEYKRPVQKSTGSLQDLAIASPETVGNLDHTTSDNTRALEFANKLSQQLGIDYQIISAAEAQELTKDATNPWNGEKSFFVGGRVYFVGDHLSTTMVLHEFAHPFLRAIGVENPQLFNKLFNDLISTEDGKNIMDRVVEEYPELDPSSNIFKEEVLVRVLQKAAADQFESVKADNSFSKAINNLLYNIKQFLRKVFGRSSNVGNLNPSTTMEELAQMLASGKQMILDTEKISESDVVAYMRDQEDYIDQIQNINSSEVQALVNTVYDIASKHIDTLMTRKDYNELAELLTDEFKRGDLQQIKSRVQGFQTIVANKAQAFQNDIEYEKQRASAFVDSLFRLETVMEKILEHMQDIMSTSTDTVDNLHKAYYYDYLVKYWETFINDFNAALDNKENNIPANSPLNKLVGDISRSISRIKNLTQEMYADGARDVLYDQLAGMDTTIKARYDAMIEKAKKSGNQKRVAKLQRDYYGVTEAEQDLMKNLNARRTSLTRQELHTLNELKQKANQGIAITPEKIEALLRGEIGDANFFNSYLEGYLYNTDPIIGGLASFVKDKMTEVMVGAQAKFNTFADDIREDLKAAGIDFSTIGSLGEKVGFVDTISTRNPKTGELEERKVWTFLNPFKDYRYRIDKLNDDVEKAQVELSQYNTDEAKKKLIDAIVARQEFSRKYMHQEYVDEYYERQALFEKDDIGKEALALRKNLFERMRMINETANSEIDKMAISEDVELLWREYRQLHSEYNLDGSRKTGDSLAIAKRLKEYADASRDFYEWKMRKGVFENAFFQYQQELADQGITQEDPKFEPLVQEWLRKNTRSVVKDEYYQDRSRILNRIQELLAVLPDSDRKAMDQTGVWEKILDLTAGFRDDDGQPNGSELSKGSIEEIKKLQEELERMRENYVQRSGLTAAEHKLMSDLYIKKSNTGLTQDERMMLADLHGKKATQGLNRWQSAELDSLYNELASMSTREATDYYVDTLNEWLSRIDIGSFVNETKNGTITKESANYILDSPHLQKMLRDNPEFNDWFTANHYQRKVFNKTTKEVELKWERLYIWNVVRPSNESFMESYEIKDATGKVIRKVAGLPATTYYARVVKPEFKTEKVVGETVDNRGSWLPKTLAQGAANASFINSEYYDLQQKDPKLFKLLEKLKAHHLKNQESLSKRSRLHLDFPRYRKSELEVLQTKGVKNIAGEKVNAITIWAKRVKEFFKGARDDAEESGYNDKSEFDLVRADMFDNEITSVPIHGLSDIDLGDVSTDITTSMMRYMLSGERQKQLVSLSPIARAIQTVVNDPKNKIKELDKVNKFNFIHRGVITYLSKSGKSVRASAVNNFIEREFEGQRMTGFTKDTPWLNNGANLLFKRASFSFFALNIPSALKNSYGAKFQALVEASAGKDVNHISLQQGNGWAYTTMGELSFGNQLYKKGVKSLRQQMVEIFDPVQDRFEDKFGESLSRTIGKDAASMSWLYNFRKWVELQASLQIFGGMMYHKKLKMFAGTPQEKEVAYMDAWEVRDGKVQLKEGIDPEWGITYDTDGNMHVGSEFKKFRARIHQKMNDLQGAYAKFDQPEAQRYLAFRFISYLRRYFTTMALNRFGFSGPVWDPRPRLNPGANDMQMGYYVEFLSFMKRFVTSAGREIMHMTPDEKAATLRVVTEVAMLIGTVAALGLIFGWDPDDDEKYEKLRAKSGALPFPLTAEDPEREFNMGGFLEVHALHLLMNIRAENEQFIPAPGYGLNDLTAMLDLKSIAFGPTLKSYGQLFDDLAQMAVGSDKAYYTREVGPYDWQQEGGSKFMSHFATMFGLTGSSLDPSKAVKGFQSAQARAR